MTAHATSLRRLRATAGLVGGLAVVAAGCGADEAPQRLAPTRTQVEVLEGITYSSPDGVDLQLDACLPPETDEGTATPAVVVVHGGGFTDGDRVSGGSRQICEDLAEAGRAAFSIDYRLAPEHRYPAQVDDLAAAVSWLRQDEQVSTFDIDPSSIAVVGSSAGAIIAQSLATRGEGDLTTGSRVAAVVSLSGVSLMTEDGLGLGEPSDQAIGLVLNYLGCDSPLDCPQAVEASPVTAVDATDSPILLVNGSDELVPQEQADLMNAALLAAGVPSELVIVQGDSHGSSLLDADVRRRAVAFLDAHR